MTTALPTRAASPRLASLPALSATADIPAPRDDVRPLAPARASSSGPPARALSGRRPRRLGPGRRLPYGMVIGPALLLAGWVVASATGALDARVLSAPWTVVATARDLIADGRLLSNLLTSAQRAFLGLALGVGLGTVLALLSGLTRVGEALVDGPVQIKRAIPTLALIPLLILWFGIGEQMKVLTIALGVVIPVYVHTHAALRTIDARYVELAETVRLSRWQFVRKVALPGALPGFLMGVRLAVTGAWLALVVVEQINATSGIGHMMSLARSYGQTEIILLGLVVYGLFGLASDSAVRLIERKTLSWRRILAG
ncbi:ABC transporter permease [Sorangium sp. So ce119]|uniref:ABC transporter permease n=1 Tax=Sorangium sp. So ce119 TaxID=3133279 RepID=UPI003F5F4A4A